METSNSSLFVEIVSKDIANKVAHVNEIYNYLRSIKRNNAYDFTIDHEEKFKNSEIEVAFNSIPNIVDALRKTSVKPEDQIVVNNKIRGLSAWKTELALYIETYNTYKLTINTSPVQDLIDIPVVESQVSSVSQADKKDFPSDISVTNSEEVSKLYDTLKADEKVKAAPETKSAEVKSKTDSQAFIDDDTDEKETIINVTNDDDLSDFDSTPVMDVETSFVDENESNDDTSIDDVTFIEEHGEDPTVKENNDYVEFLKTELDSIKMVRKSSTNPMIKLMSKMTNVDPSKVNLLDINIESDVNFQRMYLESRNNMLAAPRVTRVAHLISGFYSEISAYSEYDLISINRNISLEKDFVRKEELIYNSIFAHVVYTSFKSAATFKEWCESIYYADISSIFFGLYDANYPGINDYSLTCGQCNNDINVKLDNDDLSCYINRKFGNYKEYANDLVTLKEFKMQSNPIKDSILKKVLRKKLSKTGIIIEYGMPTLQTYLETINALKQFFEQSNVSIDIADIERPGSHAYNMLRIYLYVKKLGMPVKGVTKEDGKIPIKYLAINDRMQIVSILSSIGRQDFSELFEGKEIRELAAISGIGYYIKDVYCEHCKMKLRPVPLNPKEVFFFKLGEEPEKLQL